MAKKGQQPMTDRRHIGAKAARTAIAQLIAIHQDEFNQILGDEREGLGLPREPGPTKKPTKLDRLRQQLQEAGIEPAV